MTFPEGSTPVDPWIIRSRFLDALPRTEENFDQIAANLAHIQAFKKGILTYEEIVAGEDEYQRRNTQLGWNLIEELIAENGGIQIEIALAHPTSGNPRTIKGRATFRNGVLTEIHGGERAESTGEPFFNGLAVMKDRKGREGFVAVSLDLLGMAYVESYQFQPKFPENWRVQMRQFNLGLKPTSPKPAS